MGRSIQTGQVLLRGGDYNVQFSESGEKAGLLNVLPPCKTSWTKRVTATQLAAVRSNQVARSPYKQNFSCLSSNLGKCQSWPCDAFIGLKPT